MNTIDYFNKNGYVVLSNALTPEQCSDFVKHMFSLKEQGKLVKDDQCPLSDAVYGDPLFDDLLQRFCEPIGKQVGRRLLPTYTYARIYRPGEILKKHKDRPACEISATLTLGYDAKHVWPIFFDEERHIPVNLEPGELAVYKGCDVLHWRSEFKGNWHIQVFLHYVDADGPYKDHVRDGRPEYGIQKSVNVSRPELTTPDRVPLPKTYQQPIQTEVVHVPDIKFNRPIFNTVTIPTKDDTFPGAIIFNSTHMPELTFSVEECNRIVKLVKDTYPTSAAIGGDDRSSRVNQQIRSADIYILENDSENKWIFDKIGSLVSVANIIHFDYDISGIQHGLQLIHYHGQGDIPGHYDWHVDAGPGHVATRKISFTAQLTPGDQYEGCDLIINNHGAILNGCREQGSVHMFPGYMPHIVTPITRGERFALVIWIHGSRRFR